MYVIDNENQKSKFERPRIKRKIIEETNVSEEIAEKISLSVAKTIKDNYKEEISTNTIRSLINAQLIKRGLLEEEEKSRKLGMSVSDYEKLLSEGCKDNANIGFSPEMVSKYAYDSIAKEYALLTMPEDCANAHIEGYFHCLSENNNIIVKDSKDNILKVNIKKFVEKMFGKEDYYVPSINTNHLKKSWKKVKYATKTGYKKCYEVTFSNGYKVEVTKDHKLIKYDNKKIIPKNYDITLKDYINTGDNFIINLNYKTKEYEKLKILSYKYIGKKEVYNLTVEINHNFLAGTEGYVLVQNCHDLEYYNTRPNCMNYTSEFFAKNGLKIDGIGLMGSVAKPAKSLEVLLNHMLQALMAGATVFSGGQGFANFNTFLAPFCKGRTYSEIKQAIQGFIFNCNMSLICRGGQVLFSSIGLDLSIPEILKNRPAVAPEGVINGVYGDYQNEADMVFKAVCEVSNEKDGNGAYHRFPNILFNIRRGDLDEYEGNCKLLHELGANNPTIYYVNCMDLERTVMGCRTALPMNYFENYELDCLNTGNFMYNTINLPLIAIESENESVFYRKLDEIVELIYKSLHHRRKEVINAVYTKKMSNFLIQKDKDTGEPLWDIDRTTITIGYCGLNECLEILYDKNIIEAENEGLKIINFLNKKKEAFNKRDGLRWSVIGSPAESTAHRFAKIIKEKYPDVHVQGEEGNYYLTNSSHIPVSSEMNLAYHIKNASKFHKISQGGNILHLWLGEVWSDPVAIWKLNKKIIETGTLFWAYSKVFTFCNECGETINDKIEKCQKCGSTDLTIYDRITGYYLPTNGYNNGKKQEFEDRFRHKINI